MSMENAQESGGECPRCPQVYPQCKYAHEITPRRSRHGRATHAHALYLLVSLLCKCMASTHAGASSTLQAPGSQIIQPNQLFRSSEDSLNFTPRGFDPLVSSTMEETPMYQSDSNITYQTYTTVNSLPFPTQPQPQSFQEPLRRPDAEGEVLWSTGSLRNYFKFRGFGLGMGKSLVSLTRASLGVRLPLSANFPLWDRSAVLPRVSMFFAVYVDGTWDRAVFISISYPKQVLLMALLRVLCACNIVSQSAIRRQEIRNRASDVVQSAGVTVAMMWSRAQFRLYLGPWLFFTPGVRMLWDAAKYVYKQHVQSETQTGELSWKKGSARRSLAALKKWYSTKTSGLGMSMGYYESNVGSNMIVDLQPLYPYNPFKKRKKSPRRPATEHSDATLPPQEGGMLEHVYDYHERDAALVQIQVQRSEEMSERDRGNMAGAF